VTRGTRGRAFTLLTPENHYASRLPNFPGTQIFKLVTPRLSPARFGQYLLDVPDQGLRSDEVPAGFENFFFGLDGAITLQSEALSLDIVPRAFAYLPASASFALHSATRARLLWLKRRYEPWPGLEPPAARAGSVTDIVAEATTTPGLHRRELIDRDDPSFDFNMSLMAFDPRIGLPQVEIQEEEHGLYMTAGNGVYILDGEEHPVRHEDFIYMAPYCPQGFRAGPEGAEYLLYKDVYRDGFSRRPRGSPTSSPEW
jgi:(S)-ureidoglycine aminohydrolase